MISKEDTLKTMELSSRCLELCQDRDDLTHSDLDGAFMAVIMDAISYGKEYNKEIIKSYGLEVELLRRGNK
jgi:hypothetical protein